jgi:hypothetical protein
MKKLLYFGCGNREKGHYLFENDDSHASDDRIANAYGINKNLIRCLDGTFAPAGPEVQGLYQLSLIATTKVGLMKIIGWWDRSVDNRGQSNSALIGIGYIDAEEMIDDAYLQFPKTMGRQPRPKRILL